MSWQLKTIWMRICENDIIIIIIITIITIMLNKYKNLSKKKCVVVAKKNIFSFLFLLKTTDLQNFKIMTEIKNWVKLSYFLKKDKKSNNY